MVKCTYIFINEEWFCVIRTINLKLDVSDDDHFGVNRSSLLHGFLMNIVSPEFADSMHIAAIRPYSQNLIKDKGNIWTWQIKTLSEEAWENIWFELENVNEIFLKHCNSNIIILSKETEETSFEKLFEDAYFSDLSSKYIELEFVTPTAFKSNGRYVNYPDIRMFMSSLIRKYDFCSEKTSVYDERLMENLVNNTLIVKYNLRSTHFHLEGVKIPSFIGKITLKAGGHPNMVCMANMLAAFGQYSGVGIKNALGMGAIKIIEQRKVYANE